MYRCTGAAVAVLRHGFVTVASRCVALSPPPSGWRLKKLPGASQGFYLFISLLLHYSFFSLVASSVLVLSLCCPRESRSPNIMVEVTCSSEIPYDFGELSLKLCLLMLKVILGRTKTKNGENLLSCCFFSLCDIQCRPDPYAL